MSSYKPKSLEELNSMYDKALSAQRAIRRGTSKINETNSSDSFFDDVIKEAELTIEKEPEKRIADLSVAVDDFIKHFSEPEKESSTAAASQSVQPKAKAAEAVKPVELPKITAPKKASAIVATASPAIARKQSGEHISNLMLSMQNKLSAAIHLGNPYTMQDAPHFPRFLFTMGGNTGSVANALSVLTGDREAKGKLPITLNLK